MASSEPLVAPGAAAAIDPQTSFQLLVAPASWIVGGLLVTTIPRAIRSAGGHERMAPA